MDFKEKHARLQKPIKTPKLKKQKEKGIKVGKSSKSSATGQKSTKKPRIKKVTVSKLKTRALVKWSKAVKNVWDNKCAYC